ncbi:adenosylcobinamide-GDP ribazoletransferase [Streptomyces indicus]|uniref:Adenosylcobinamide-GDP ribazoletransferase n=1 Tax=Streptomyces indicus TaxID=417292 RepID=A0A1G8YQS8_9ACTN|nr:adenosylcobinamide-GDP ribazoletransferase [Streptomyces indicus]SDK05131.1 adenosylcobinamide-GDP ribazoletransferase [Streptomyces indicus]
MTPQDDTAPPPARLADGVRFAFGTLTVLPVRVDRWDRTAARAGMLCAPLAGLVVGLCAGAAGGLLLLLGAGPLLAAVATAAVPALLTRALHLDGLADTADGLGSGKPAAEALTIMKRSDIGPFGVVTLLFVLLAQVAVFFQVYEEGGWAAGAVAAAVAHVAGRTALTLASRPSVPAARPEGLGAAVAGTVPWKSAVAVSVLVICLAGAGGYGTVGLLRGALAVAGSLVAGELLLRRCVRRFGGITGDVFGAVAEAAVTGALLVLALG